MTEKIENVTIDEEVFPVDDLPEELQSAVRKYEEWRERLALAQDEVSLVGAAIRDLSTQIVAGIRQHQENRQSESENDASQE